MTSNDTDRPLYSIAEEEEPLYKIDDYLDRDPAPADDGDSPEEEEEEEEHSDEEEETDAGAEEAAPSDAAKSRPSPLGILLKTMMTPVEGWKALKRARFSTDAFASGCFYPLVAVTALSEATSMFYEANVTVADWLTDGIIAFVTFFFGYFTALLAGGLILPRRSRELMHKDIGRQLVMLSMSTLAIFWTLIQIAPMLEPVLVFLPIWTIYLIYKGVRVLRVPEDTATSTTGILCMLVIGCPLLWNWILTEVLFPLTGR